MISDDLGKVLHDRATRGEALSDEEQLQLERWYADQDKLESDILATTPEEKTIDSQADSIQSAWNRIRTELEQEKGRIYEQIGHYPPPIAACDQQFNHLLDQQKQILQELARLNEAENESLNTGDPFKVVDHFIRSSPYNAILIFS
jgi:hypothetical protein